MTDSSVEADEGDAGDAADYGDDTAEAVGPPALSAGGAAVSPDAVSYPRRIRQLASIRPAQTALRFAAIDGPERVIDWPELDVRSTQIARGLAADGLGAGDRVAVELHNSPELVETVLAAWKLGAVPVPVRWDLPDWERARVLEVIGAKTVINADSTAWLADTRALDDTPLPDLIPAQTHGICSSGSTGTPKVILMDRPAVWDPATSEPFPSGWMEVPRPQVILVPAPLYHTNGFATLSSLIAGDEIVLMEKFNAARVVELIERHRVTTFTATPTMLQRIADLPNLDQRDLSSIVWVLQGAAVIGSSLVRRWLDLVGPEHLFMAYGMTEGLGLTALRGDEWLTHAGSVGRGYRDTEIRILDGDGHDLAAGEIGEIFLRSPTSGLYRYLGGAPLLASTDDGFSTAGDMGYLDDDGFLYILDRRVDMVITGGANVFPAEVESALIDHPAVADVVVIGLTDPEWGRRVHAVIEPADHAGPPGADEIIAFAKTRLAPYKVPKSVEFVDFIPRTEATKVSRAALIAAREG
jgi:bile acid-coenzyme A ligase